MSEVNWYENDLRIAIDNASDEFLKALALQITGEAKVDAPVDTGFLRNSDYVIAPGMNTFTPQDGPDGRSTVHSAPSVGDKEAVAGFAADYAIYVEMDHPFLYPALLRVQRQAGGIIEQAGRKHLG